MRYPLGSNPAALISSMQGIAIIIGKVGKDLQTKGCEHCKSQHMPMKGAGSIGKKTAQQSA
jgi:hypothetical protein